MDSAHDAMQNGPLSRAEAEAGRVTAVARERGIVTVTLGGAAVFLRCPSASRPPLQRECKDIDLVTTRSMTQRLSGLLEEIGYAPDKRFNALHGSQRLFFWDEHNSRQMDVFVDRFEMCHTFDLRNRIALDVAFSTLPLADLLLTKMQVVELNFKDMQDIAALLQDHPLTDDEHGINLGYIVDLTRTNWGLQRTIEGTSEQLGLADNLARLVAEEPRYALEEQLRLLQHAMDQAPKSTGWKLRARIGERKRWYEVPEEARA
ncbi:MAG: hypothetical protein NVS2B16_09940 [Chloroflexota bacterium]